MNRNDYYVYAHKRKDNGQVFYVGSGRGKRAYSKSTRNKSWQNVVSSCGGFEVDFLATSLSKDESISIETSFIINSDWALTNKRLPDKEHNVDYEEVSKLWAYDEKSKTGLIWVGSKFPTLNGSVAGGLQKTGGGKEYWVVRKDRKLYLAHRIVCVLHGHDVSGKVIDHLDGNGLNNKIENLRVTSQLKNSIKIKPTSRSTTGHAGLSLLERHGRRFYMASIMFDGARFCKRFYLDEGCALERAIEWRQNRLKEYLDSLGE